LHLETPTRPEKGCTQLLGRARAERRSQPVRAPAGRQTTRYEYQKVASMTRRRSHSSPGRHPTPSGERASARPPYRTRRAMTSGCRR
jgi:hypothetical protein